MILSYQILLSLNRCNWEYILYKKGNQENTTSCRRSPRSIVKLESECMQKTQTFEKKIYSRELEGYIDIYIYHLLGTLKS